MSKIWHGGNPSKTVGGFIVNKLKLPVIKGSLSEPRTLSMDEYLKFVQFNLRHAFDRKAYAKWKRVLAVDVPFHLK